VRAAFGAMLATDCGVAVTGYRGFEGNGRTDARRPPPSASMLAAAPTGLATRAVTGGASSALNASAPPNSTITRVGKVNVMPPEDSTTDSRSVLPQLGTGTTAKIGIDTTTPASTLDVKGGATVRGPLSLPSSGAATATAGQDSQPVGLAAPAFSDGTGKAVAQTFELQAEPADNDTGSPSGSLNLLFGFDTEATETDRASPARDRSRSPEAI
jgi:hypothetical protein